MSWGEPQREGSGSRECGARWRIQKGRGAHFTLDKPLTSQQPKMGLGVRGDEGSRERNKGKEEGRKEVRASRKAKGQLDFFLLDKPSVTHTPHFS